jgi:hypothetical protein
VNDRAAYNRDRRLQRERKGVCTMCQSREPGREPRPGLKTCAVCARAAADRERGREPRYKPTGKPLGRPRRGVDVFSSRRGECQRCTAPHAPGAVLCPGHLATLKELAAECGRNGEVDE